MQNGQPGKWQMACTKDMCSKAIFVRSAAGTQMPGLYNNLPAIYRRHVLRSSFLSFSNYSMTSTKKN
jgi:hypothetical protein